MNFRLFAALIIVLSSCHASVVRRAVALAKTRATTALPLVARSVSTLDTTEDVKTVGTIRDLADVVRIPEALRAGEYDLFDPYELRREGYPNRLPFPFGIWYRGQWNREFRLTPSINRVIHEHGKTYRVDEATIFREFQLKLPHLQTTLASDLAWLTLMQHHGLPTRLLDWTENILVALFFAVTSGQPDTTGRLYMMNAARLNNVALGEEMSFGVCLEDWLPVKLRTRMVTSRSPESLFNDPEILTDVTKVFGRKVDTSRDMDVEALMTSLRLERPVAFTPQRTHARLQARSGTFTLGGGRQLEKARSDAASGPHFPAPMSLEEMNVESMKTSGKPVVVAFDIEDRSQISEQLRGLGFSSAQLMGDPDSHARETVSVWRYPIDEDERR